MFLKRQQIWALGDGIWRKEKLNLSAGIFKQSMGARNQVGIGFSYLPARLHSLADFFSLESILGLLISLKFGLWTLTLDLYQRTQQLWQKTSIYTTKLVEMAVANHGMPKIIGSTLLSIWTVTFVETKSSRGKSPDYFALKLSWGLIQGLNTVFKGTV
jgi:hypothetical protein